MFLSNFSVKKPIVTIVVLLMLMAAGLLALKKLKVNQIPDVDMPLLVVDIVYPGASPDTVEREVLNRIEKALQSVNGVKELRGTANESNANIKVFFEFKKNMVEATDEVRNAIGKIRYKLPTEIREPVILRLDPAAQPIMQLALSSSSQSHAEISRLAEDQIADKLRGIAGVAQVNVNGALKRELSVLLHAQKLREVNLSVTEVVNALRTQNAAAPVGKIRGVLEDQSIGSH
jgi:multidrug efflux pump subunit AcrB